LAKFLNENNYTMGIGELNDLSVNLVHNVILILSGQFPDERHNAFRPVKPARESLDLFKAHFKDNEIYSKILNVVYGDKVDSCFTRHKTHDPEKQKIIFIAQ
jgi:hypothetical protein